MAQKGRKQRKHERTLGQAIGLAVGVTLGVGVLIFLALMLVPGTTLPNFYKLAHYDSSATLRMDPLFQQWAESLQRDEALFGTPLSLLCGGLALGWFAPRYAATRRVLVSGAGMALALLGICLTFLWLATVIQQNMMNANEGGTQVYVTAPGYVIRNQILWGAIWTVICVGGTWLGLRLRSWHMKKEPATPLLKTAGR